MGVGAKMAIPRGLFHTISGAYAFVYILLTLSLVSFSSADRSFSSVEVSKYASNTNNIFGVLGAYVSDMFLVLMGVGAFLVPVIMARPLLIVWQQRKATPTASSAFYLIFNIAVSFALVLMASFTLGFVWGTTPFLESYLAFGIIGAVSKVILSTFVGGAGGIIMAIFLLPFLMILYLSTSFDNIAYNLKNPANPFSKLEYVNSFLQEAFALKKSDNQPSIIKRVAPVAIAPFLPMVWLAGVVIRKASAIAQRGQMIDLSGKRSGDGRTDVAQTEAQAAHMTTPPPPPTPTHFPVDNTQTASFQYAETLAANLAYPTASANSTGATTPTATMIETPTAKPAEATPTYTHPHATFSFEPPNPELHTGVYQQPATTLTSTPLATTPLATTLEGGNPAANINSTNTFMGGLISERRGIEDLAADTAANTDVNTAVNPDVNTAVNTAVNPDVNTAVNPDVNTNVNPDVNTNVNPDVTPAVTPSHNDHAPLTVPEPTTNDPKNVNDGGVLNIKGAVPRTPQQSVDVAPVPAPVPASVPASVPTPEVFDPVTVAEPVPATPEVFDPVTVAEPVPAPVPAPTSVPAPVPASTFTLDDEEEYNLPYSFLQGYKQKSTSDDDASLWAEADVLNKRLNEFGIGGRITHISSGPVVITYEFEPAPGVKVSRITALSDDIALAMSVTSVRVIAPIPGKGVVGFEIPRRNREMVVFKQLIDDPMFKGSGADLNIAVGQDVNGKPFFADLAKMPHVLIAGTTGSGKSVAINTIICSLVYNHSPNYVKFIMIDPKMVELSIYEDIPHLAAPVVTDTKIAAKVLRNVVKEMEQRYALLKDSRAKSITSYNAKAETNGLDKLSYLVVIVDEFADLMMVAGKEVEQSVIRLAQMARAVGIHLILATQRPSVDVITGIIKANMPSRLGFKVSSKVDSRTVIDRQGAEQLLGNGDSLFIMSGKDPIRLHGAFISEDEVNDIADHLRTLGEPEYDMALIQQDTSELGDVDDDELDEKYYEAVEIVTQKGFASISMVQRHLRIGYNRAARIVEIMEQKGVVAPSDGSSRPREVLQKGKEA